MVSLMLPPLFTAEVVIVASSSSKGGRELRVASIGSSLSDLFNEKVKLLWLPPQLEPPPPAELRKVGYIGGFPCKVGERRLAF